jgi:Glycosyltransferase
LHHNGGSETYVFKLGAYLRKQGHEVQYFGMEHQDRCVSNEANVYTSNMNFHEGQKLSQLLYPLKTIYSIEARKKIRILLNGFSPEVVHLNNFNYQITPSIIIEIKKWSQETKRKVRIIYTAHDYQLVCPNHQLRNPNTNQNCEKCLTGHFFNCIKGKCIHSSTAKSIIGAIEAYFWNSKKVYKHIDKIICCSGFMKKKIDSNHLLREKTIMIRNFIDGNAKRAIDKKDYVIYFGRYSNEKGISTLVKVCEELGDIQFIFAGLGPLENKINSISNISNVGFKSGKELEMLIKEARFSIHPSEWYENCPFSVMESQMYGTPVLGANIGGIPELVRVGQTGELFESGNIAELKTKIRKLWSQPALIKNYTKNCESVAFDTTDEYYQKLIGIYQES